MGKLPVDNAVWDQVLVDKAEAEGLQVSAGRLLGASLEQPLAVATAAAETFVCQVIGLTVPGEDDSNRASRMQPAILRWRLVSAMRFGKGVALPRAGSGARSRRICSGCAGLGNSLAYISRSGGCRAEAR